MNAYWCYADDEIERVEWEDWFSQAGHYENYAPFDIIFSETRGTARAKFARLHNLEFADKMHIRVIAKSISRGPGIAGASDPLWGLVFDGVGG